MTLIDLSSDQVRIMTADTTHTLPPQGMEKNFGKVISTLPAWESIIVIHGPWSYTTLRLGCFLLNQLNLVSVYRYPLITINKLQIAFFLFQKWHIGPVGDIYIGQQRNVRTIDMRSATTREEIITTKTSSETLQTTPHSTRRAEKTHAHRLGNNQRHNIHLHWQWHPQGIALLVNDQQHIRTPPTDHAGVKHIEPYYGIAPTTG